MQAARELTSDEKLWAAIAHGSSLVPLWGSIVAAIIWFTQRQRSAYVRFHSLQAMSYHVLSLWAFTWIMPLLLIGLVVLAVAGIVLIGPDTLDNDTAGLIFSLGVQAIIWGGLLAAFGLYALVGLIGGGFSLAGREFRYPLFGKALARKLGYSGPDSGILEEQEEQVAGAVAHSTAVLLMFGAIVPLAIWVTQKERSRFLGFQSLQAAVYQGLGALGYFLAMGLYVLSAAAFTGYGILGALEHGSEPNITALLLILTPMLCFMFLVAIGGPTFHLFSIIASLRVLRGHDYKYPLLGRYLQRRTQASAAGPEPSQV
jgi:uncharacterized Tic20 family protein